MLLTSILLAKTASRARPVNDCGDDCGVGYRDAYGEAKRGHVADPATRQFVPGQRLYIGPAFGDEPIGKVKARNLESFYAELRRCSQMCDGRPRIEHRAEGDHECRVIKHKRRRGSATGTPLVSTTTWIASSCRAVYGRRCSTPRIAAGVAGRQSVPSVG